MHSHGGAVGGVYLKNVPPKGEHEIFEPLFYGPFRVMGIITPVVLRLRHVSGGQVKTIHTNNVLVLHEESLGLHDSSA